MTQLYISLFILFFTSEALAQIELCDGIIIHDGKEIEFTDTEKRLICGDSKVKAYEEIPTYQASYFLIGLLQSRSYLRPTFETKEGVLHVFVGPSSKLKKIKVMPMQNIKTEEIEDELQRLHGKKPLHPKLLNSLESDTLSFLRRNGSPCSKVETIADAEESLATITLNKTDLHHFGVIEKEKISGLRDNALERYYPFEARDLFSERLLKLTEKRMLRTQVVQGTYFLEDCSDNPQSFSIKQHFIEGPPRTLRFGVGASTEEGSITRVRWANHRHGSMASILGANLQASFRSQSLTLMADSFFWKHLPRRSLYSDLEIKRDSQLEYEEFIVKLRSQVKWTTDHWNRFWQWTIGPSLETGTFRSDENATTRTYSTGAIEGGLQWMSHLYEYYDLHPEEGDLFNFNFGLRHPTLGFSDPLLKLDSTIMKLYPLAHSGRGAIVGGIRLNTSTTWVSDNVPLETLPPSVKHYGGGSDDVRGFFLQTIPRNNGLGALSKIGTKLELRRTRLVRDSIEGFIFVDGAYFGTESWSTDPRLWNSPGIGLRWLSPIGLVQTFVARSYVTKPYEDFGIFYFLGFGGTF